MIKESMNAREDEQKKKKNIIKIDMKESKNYKYIYNKRMNNIKEAPIIILQQ